MREPRFRNLANDKNSGASVSYRRRTARRDVSVEFLPTTVLIVDCLQCTPEDLFIFHLVRGHGAFVTFMISLRRI